MRGNPVKYNDPTGHRLICALDPECGGEGGNGDGGIVGSNGSGDNDHEPEVIVFCGSGGDINSDGPGCPGQMPAWDDNPAGYMMYFQQYLGGGKYITALAAGEIEIPDNIPLILICYSAGTEACLMYAKERVASGGAVQSVALLGPTFTGTNEDGIELSYDGWKSYMDDLLISGTDILIVDDNDRGLLSYLATNLLGGWNSPTDAVNYQAPESATGVFGYYTTNAKHSTRYPNWIQATNTSSTMSDFIFSSLDIMAAGR